MGLNDQDKKRITLVYPNGSAEDNAEQIKKDLVPIYVALLRKKIAEAYEKRWEATNAMLESLYHYTPVSSYTGETNENTVVKTAKQNNSNAETRENLYAGKKPVAPKGIDNSSISSKYGDIGQEIKYPSMSSDHFQQFDEQKKRIQEKIEEISIVGGVHPSDVKDGRVPTPTESKDNDFLLLLSKVMGAAHATIINPLLALPRAPITDALGRSHAYATDLPEVLTASMAQCKSVTLQGQLIEKIKNDPDMQRAEAKFIEEMKADAGFIKNGKYKDDKGFPVQFGGSRGNGNGGWTAEGAKNAALNELTWIIRNTTVMATAVRNNDGTATITYSLHLDEKLDLRPNGSEIEYDVITRILGYGYHDVLGGNDQMRVKATWEKTIKLEK